MPWFNWLKMCSLPVHRSWCVASVPAQNGCHTSPRWPLHIGGGWGEFPLITVKHLECLEKCYKNTMCHSSIKFSIMHWMTNDTFRTRLHFIIGRFRLTGVLIVENIVTSWQKMKNDLMTEQMPMSQTCIMLESVKAQKLFEIDHLTSVSETK